jgi:heptosyltransferase-3
MTSARTATTAADASRNEAPRWHLALAWTLAGLGFFLPFSSAGVAIAEFALLLLLFTRPRTTIRGAPWREPVMGIGLALLLYIALHSLVTSGFTMDTVHGINHYQELLLAPVLLTFLQDPRDRRLFLRALMAGAIFLSLCFWAIWFDPTLYDFGAWRISASFALTICAFVLVVRSRGQERPWPQRALALFFVLTVLFAINARTGYVLLLLLASCAAWLHSAPRWRWLAAIACPLAVLVVGVHSEAVQRRVQETLAGSQPADGTGAYTSTTTRIELIKLSADLAGRYALAGAGFANYPRAHEEAARQRYGEKRWSEEPHPIWFHSDNPHSEYVMQLVGGGIVALVLYLAWLGAPLVRAARASPPIGGLLAGITLAFAVGCLFNSWLLDFMEGHLYVSLLAWLVAESRAERETEGVRRILVVATRQIGDVLLTTPLLQAARQRWPQARLDVLGFTGTLGMLRGNPDVDQLLEVPGGFRWANLRSLFWQIWRSYDLALVADPGDRAHLMGWLAAPQRSGIVPAQGGSNWIKRALLDHVVVSAGDLGSVHVTAEKQALLAPWRTATTTVQVVPTPAAPLPAPLRDAVKPGAVIVHAPSMWPYKQWPIQHFQQLVAALLAQGRQVILTGSQSERDQECVAALRRLASAPQLLDLSGRLDFNQLSGLLQGAALYIGPDTSVSHLAAATGVPVIAILGPTNPQRWAPWPARSETQALFQRSTAVQTVGNVTVLQGTQSCVPCGRAGCEDHRGSRSDCLISITPQQVLEQVEQILKETAPA